MLAVGREFSFQQTTSVTNNGNYGLNNAGKLQRVRNSVKRMRQRCAHRSMFDNDPDRDSRGSPRGTSTALSLRA
jgi:hypothetical protein